MADKKQNAVKYGEVIAKCWDDEAYRKRFLEDPEGVLTEAGFVVDEGVTYKVIEQPKMVRYIVLPHEHAKEAVQTFSKIFLNKVEENDAVIPEGAEARIIQNTDDVRYMILPASPKTLTKSELSKAAGGSDIVVSPNASTTAAATTLENVVVAAEAAQTTTQTTQQVVDVVVSLVAVLI